MLRLQWMARQRQPTGKTEGRASFQSHPKQPVVSTQLALNKNRGLPAWLPSSHPDQKTFPASLGLLSYLSVCIFIIAIDLQGPFPSPLVSAWQGSWLFSSLTWASPPFPVKQRSTSCLLSIASGLGSLCHQELSDLRVFVSPVSSPAPPDNMKLGEL